MKSGGRVGDETYHERVRRSRFRLSFTVAVLQLLVATVGVGVALLVTGNNNKTATGKGQATGRPGTLSANAGGAASRHQRTSTITRTVTQPAIGPTPSVGSPTVYGASWPAGFSGYTVALASDIIKSDAVGAVTKATMAGLRHVGVLRSDHYTSLSPGYLFVFSGVYRTPQEAEREVPNAVAAGFSDAYVRRVAE